MELREATLWPGRERLLCVTGAGMPGGGIPVKGSVGGPCPASWCLCHGSSLLCVSLRPSREWGSEVDLSSLHGLARVSVQP